MSTAIKLFRAQPGAVLVNSHSLLGEMPHRCPALGPSGKRPPVGGARTHYLPRSWHSLVWSYHIAAAGFVGAHTGHSDRGCPAAALCRPENTDAGKRGERWEERACLLRDFSEPLRVQKMAKRAPAGQLWLLQPLPLWEEGAVSE